MSFKVLSILLICLLSGLSRSFNIGLDQNFPVMISPVTPSNPTNGSTFMFKFSLPAATANAIGPYASASSGLTFGQFIGVAFPPSVGTSDLNLDQGSGKWSCSLTDGTYTYKVSPVLPVASPIVASMIAESNTAYCRLDDLSANVPLKVGSGITYTLKVTLNSPTKIVSTNFLRGISLFTSTSNNPEKMIIDSVPVIGTAAIYADYSAYSPKALDIVNTQVTVTQGASAASSGSNVYPYNQFDITLTLKSNSFITAADHIIVFGYPATAVSPAGTVLTNQAAVSDPLQVALKGNLSLSTFGVNGILLSGMGEDLIPNRQFQISLKGWKALDNTNAGQLPIVVNVWYKNTYSVLSYASSNIFLVTADSSTLTANHPEFWDVYRGGAWPIAFTLKTSNDLVNGGWVVIQQNNTADFTPAGTTAANKITFVPSTCDFSGNDSSFDNSFGKRPSCYPLRTLDLAYPSTTSPYAGSGFFFFLKGTISSSKTYRVTIWAFFDQCGAALANGYGNILATTAYASPSFSANIYKSITATALNESRFTGLNAISTAPTATFGQKCWFTALHQTDAASNINDSLSAAAIGATTLSVAVTAAANEFGVFNYREVTDWVIASESTDLYGSIATTFFSNMSTGTYSNTLGKYLYSSTTNLISNSFFVAAFQVKPIAATKNLLGYTGLPAVSSTSHPSGKWVWQFPSQWFVQGNLFQGTGANCYAGWNISGTVKTYVTDLGNANGKESPFSTSQTLYGTNTGFNFFGAQTTAPTGVTSIDTGNTNIPTTTTAGGITSSNAIVKLVSNMNDKSALATVGGAAATISEARWAIIDYTKLTVPTAPESVNLGFFTSCVKWVATYPTITSLYTYIDIQLKWHYIRPTGAQVSTLGTPLSNIRLIKLFPETGVFQDNAKNFASPTSTNPYINHIAYTTTSQDSICLIELSAAYLYTTNSPTTSNTLVIWLFGGTLLESDYNDTSATYPVAPLSSAINAYGLQTGLPIEINTTNANSNPQAVVGGLIGTAAPTTANVVYTGLLQALSNNNSELATVTTNLANSSNYMWFFGSTLFLTSVGTSLTGTAGSEVPFYIPYYCPRQNSLWVSATASSTYKHGTAFPLFMAAWMNASSYSSYTAINSWVNYTANTTTGKVFLNRTVASTPTMGAQKTITGPNNTPITPATLRFGQYTNLTDSLVHIFIGNLVSPTGTATTCTGHVLLLNSQMAIDSTVTTPVFAGLTFTGTAGVLNGTKNFYAFGKTFTKAILYGLGQANNTTPAPPATSNMNTSVSTVATSVNTISGVKRPSVDTFVVGTDLVLTDKLAYGCASASNASNQGLTNYVVVASKFNSFILDWNSNLTAQWSTSSISWDKTDVYKNDVAANFKTVLSPPVYVSANSQLVFTAGSNAIGSNTICGLITTSGSIVTSCTSPSAGTISCQTPIGGTSFTICCYNVVVSDPIVFNSVTVVLPADTGATSGVLSISPYLTSTVYSAASQIGTVTSPFSFVTSNASAVDVIGTKAATITQVIYSQVNQESGYGKVTFTVSLPREPTRDMKLSITGDFSGLIITGNIPRCYATFSNNAPFGSTWDNGDVMIDTCSANGIAGSVPVVITTKKIVYKCGISFSKSIYVSLWPVSVVNWANASVNKTFKVSMTLNSGDNIALNTSTFTMTMSTPTSAKPAAIGQIDTLCAVSSITPRIPGEVADYVFNIDLDTNKALLTSTSPNEVTIFFPYQFYGSFLDSVLCYSGQMLNCSFTDEGILNIRFTSNIPIGSGKPIQITVVNILNPAIDSDYSFPCTVNTTNFSTGARTNLITGTGKLAGGINTTTVTSQGALRYYQVSTPVTDKNPRNTSTHKFRVAFDNAIGLTSTTIVFTGSPVINIKFPNDYKLAWYTNKPTASIDEYTSDSNNNITKTSTIVPASVVQSGNRVTITLSQTSYSFTPTWRYWDISISNIVNPIDTTVTGTLQSTKQFTISLYNPTLTMLYRTFTNDNTYVSDLLTNAGDSNPAVLSFARGNAFSFDNSKWVIDIYANVAQLNILTVRAGRFLQAFYNIKSNSSNAILPWVTSMSLTDNNFKTSVASYSLSTSYNQPIPFYIGCSCGTAPGYYLVNFTSTDSTLFAALAPIMITVDTSSKGIISFQTPATIPAAGSTMIGIFLSDPNFDTLNVNWIGGDNVVNDSTTKITNVVIPTATVTTPTNSGSNMSPVFSTFSITSSSQTLPAQVFKTADPNACFTWNGINVISFNISGQTAIIPSSLNLATYFKYTNSSNDTTVTIKNSIRLNFTPPAAPIYIYCALACFNMAYPSDASIMTVPAIAPPTQYLQFYTNVISNNTPTDIVFTGLVRGMQYHMRCIIQSTQGDPTQRTSSSVNIENYVVAGTTNSTTVTLTPTAPQLTQCVQWQFLSEPGQSTRNAVANYCQKLYSTPGWYNNGCIICTFSDLSYNTPGLVLPLNITCPASSGLKRLRMLQTTTNSNATLSNPVTLTVCPVAHPVCATDVSGNKIYTDYFNQLINDLKTPALFLSTLNINNVFLNSTVPTVTITDLNTPDLTKLAGSVTSSNQNGAVSFTAQFTSPIACYWMIQDASVNAPTMYSTLQTCTDPNWCGTAKVGLVQSTVSTVNLKAFTAGSTYNVYMSCTNDIPFSQKQTIVQKVGSFNFPAASTPVTPVPISGSFVSYSLMALLMVFALLF